MRQENVFQALIDTIQVFGDLFVHECPDKPIVSNFGLIERDLFQKYLYIYLNRKNFFLFPLIINYLYLLIDSDVSKVFCHSMVNGQ